MLTGPKTGPPHLTVVLTRCFRKEKIVPFISHMCPAPAEVDLLLLQLCFYNALVSGYCWMTAAHIELSCAASWHVLRGISNTKIQSSLGEVKSVLAGPVHSTG